MFSSHPSSASAPSFTTVLVRVVGISLPPTADPPLVFLSPSVVENNLLLLDGGGAAATRVDPSGDMNDDVSTAGVNPLPFQGRGRRSALVASVEDMLLCHVARIAIGQRGYACLRATTQKNYDDRAVITINNNNIAASIAWSLVGFTPTAASATVARLLPASGLFSSSPQSSSSSFHSPPSLFAEPQRLLCDRLVAMQSAAASRSSSSSRCDSGAAAAAVSFGGVHFERLTDLFAAHLIGLRHVKHLLLLVAAYARLTQAGAVEDADPLRVVMHGPASSGKSTLLRALFEQGVFPSAPHTVLFAPHIAPHRDRQPHITAAQLLPAVTVQPQVGLLLHAGAAHGADALLVDDADSAVHQLLCAVLRDPCSLSVSHPALPWKALPTPTPHLVTVSSSGFSNNNNSATNHHRLLYHCSLFVGKELSEEMDWEAREAAVRESLSLAQTDPRGPSAAYSSRHGGSQAAASSSSTPRGSRPRHFQSHSNSAARASMQSQTQLAADDPMSVMMMRSSSFDSQQSTTCSLWESQPSSPPNNASSEWTFSERATFAALDGSGERADFDRPAMPRTPDDGSASWNFGKTQEPSLAERFLFFTNFAFAKGRDVTVSLRDARLLVLQVLPRYTADLREAYRHSALAPMPTAAVVDVLAKFVRARIALELFAVGSTATGGDDVAVETLDLPRLADSTIQDFVQCMQVPLPVSPDACMYPSVSSSRKAGGGGRTLPTAVAVKRCRSTTHDFVSPSGVVAVGPMSQKKTILCFQEHLHQSYERGTVFTREELRALFGQLFPRNHGMVDTAIEQLSLGGYLLRDREGLRLS